MNKLFIGIDVSSKDLQIAITDSKNIRRLWQTKLSPTTLLELARSKKLFLILLRRTIRQSDY